MSEFLLPGRIRRYTIQSVNTFFKSDEFNDWLLELKDQVGKAIIAKRIRAAESGRFGDCEPVGEGVSEMRIHYGPGYRKRGDPGLGPSK